MVAYMTYKHTYIQVLYMHAYKQIRIKNVLCVY